FELSSADKTDTAAVPTDSSSEPTDSSSEQTDTASDASAAPAVSAGAGAAGPRSLRADRPLANSPMSRCVADFRAPRGETPGHRKASHRRVRPNLQQARPNRQPARPSRQQM